MKKSSLVKNKAQIQLMIFAAELILPFLLFYALNHGLLWLQVITGGLISLGILVQVLLA